MAIIDQISNMYDAAKSKMGLPSNSSKIPIISEDPAESAKMVTDLLADAQAYRSQFYFNRLGFQDGTEKTIDPIIFWAYCHLLETGDHWRVWGTRRKDKKDDDWKAEAVENEIGNQIRVLTAYLAANWHSFTITPNVANINEILQQDQKMTDWSNTQIEIAKRISKYGSCIVKSVMNFDIDPRGIATEEIVDNAGFLVSPFTTGISRSKGCWHVIERSYQPIWLLAQQYREDMAKLGIEVEDISPVSVDKTSTTDKVSTYLMAPSTYNYKRSQSTEFVQIYFDDFTEVDAPFSPEEFKASIASIVQGGNPPINPYSNHKMMIENYLRYLSERNSMASDPSTTPEDHQQLDGINERVGQQIQNHLHYRIDGKMLKNPNGRKICLAGGKTIQDVPSPWHFDWRKLYHWINFESIDGQLWGRGLAEILWSTNKSLDLMKSRISDMGLFAVPEVWLSSDNKPLFGGKNKYVKDPTQIKYYNGSPPVSPQSRAPMEFVEMFKIDKEAAARAYAVNSTTYGETPGADVSGKAINILSDQNSILVTGQPNVNFGNGVESIIETRLKMMKQFYTEERLYRIQGEYVPVVVSKLLSEQRAVENGQVLRNPDGTPVMRPIPDLEVSVKPGSNLPNAWEEELSTLVKIQSTQPPRPDGSVLIPDEAIYDRLGERFPEFAAGGKYRTLNKATQIGLQVMQQQQLQQEQEAEQQKIVADVAKKKLRQKLTERTMPKPTNGNGSQ